MFRREHRFVASRLATVRTMTRSGRVHQGHGRRDLVNESVIIWCCIEIVIDFVAAV